MGLCMGYALMDMTSMQMLYFHHGLWVVTLVFLFWTGFGTVLQLSEIVHFCNLFKFQTALQLQFWRIYS